jgi:CheY-like chemotaxis protein
MTIRVAIADDQAMVRRGFRLLLEDEPDMAVVAEAGDGETAEAAVRRFDPDVALMDIRMPGTNGLEATRRLAGDPDLRTRILILTTFDLDEYVFEALRAGAAGFLLKEAPPEQLIRCRADHRRGRCAARRPRHAPGDRGVPRGCPHPPSPRRSCASSPSARSTSCTCSRGGDRTARSRPSCTSARPPRRPTSATSSASSACGTACRR